MRQLVGKSQESWKRPGFPNDSEDSARATVTLFELETANRSPQPHEDLALVEAVRRGETKAVDTFLERMRVVRKLVRLKNLRYGEPVDANAIEDIVQETLVAIWRRLDTYEGRGSLDAWVYRFCHNVYLWKARSFSQRKTESPDELETLQDRESGHLDPFLQRAVYEALEKVGPPGSDVIRAKHLEGLTFGEIASAQGASIGMVKSQYYRALSRVREALGSKITGDAPQEDSR